MGKPFRGSQLDLVRSKQRDSLDIFGQTSLLNPQHRAPGSQHNIPLFSKQPGSTWDNALKEAEQLLQRNKIPSGRPSNAKRSEQRSQKVSLDGDQRPKKSQSNDDDGILMIEEHQEDNYFNDLIGHLEAAENFPNLAAKQWASISESSFRMEDPVDQRASISESSFRMEGPVDQRASISESSFRMEDPVDLKGQEEDQPAYLNNIIGHLEAAENDPTLAAKQWASISESSFRTENPFDQQEEEHQHPKDLNDLINHLEAAENDPTVVAKQWASFSAISAQLEGTVGQQGQEQERPDYLNNLIGQLEAAASDPKLAAKQWASLSEISFRMEDAGAQQGQEKQQPKQRQQLTHDQRHRNVSGDGYDSRIDSRRSRQSDDSVTTARSEVSEEFMQERASQWGYGVALKDSSKENTPRTSGASSTGRSRAGSSSSQAIPGVSRDVKDALSSFMLAFLVCDYADPEMPILYCSAGFTTMTGYTTEEITGKNW
jgi:hypothetical protein